jgi:ubiquinone/menaquinone biosynthesis C-methylase UbiE
MRWFERWFLAELRQQALNEIPAEANVLELGAGTGLNFCYYKSKMRGVATEPNQEMIRQAVLKSRPEKISLIQSCAEELPFADSTFDAAFATLVFCSVSSPPQAFAELKRVVKPGGKIVLVEHVRPGGVLGYVFDFLNLITVSLFDDHLNRRTAEMVQAAGIKVSTVESRLAGIINLIKCNV